MIIVDYPNELPVCVKSLIHLIDGTMIATWGMDAGGPINLQLCHIQWDISSAAAVLNQWRS